MKTSQNHLPSLLSSILFILGALFLFGIGLVMGVTALVSFVTGTEVQAEQTVFSCRFWLSKGSFCWWQRSLHFKNFFKSHRQIRSIIHLDFQLADRSLIVITCASILIGYQIGGIKTINWLLLPILTIPAVVLPLGVLLAFGTRKLPFGTRWQTWSVLGLGMSLTPLILFASEIFIGHHSSSRHCGLYHHATGIGIQNFRRLSQQIMILGPQSEAALDLLSPFLTKPGCDRHGIDLYSRPCPGSGGNFQTPRSLAVCRQIGIASPGICSWSVERRGLCIDRDDWGKRSDGGLGKPALHTHWHRACCTSQRRR